MERRIGVIGGTGLYAWPDAEPLDFETDHGPVTVSHRSTRGRRVFFLPRHGADHARPPDAVEYRANVSALRAAHVEAVVAVFNVGSLVPEFRTGSWVVPDDLLDETTGRTSTFHEGAVHVALDPPFCPDVRSALLEAAPGPAGAHATLAVTDGPRFETRAETRDLADRGAHLVGMTAMPEAALAREAGLCYAALCLIGNVSGKGANPSVIQRRMAEQRDSVVSWVDRVAGIRWKKSCSCQAGAAVRPLRAVMGGRQ